MRPCNPAKSSLFAALVFCAGLACIACLPLHVRAQTAIDLDRVLFEPQPLDVAVMLASAPVPISPTSIEPVTTPAAATSGVEAIQQYLDLIANEELIVCTSVGGADAGLGRNLPATR
jgi:hypothetical protein